jgi:voltage-gated potassium channel
MKNIKKERATLLNRIDSFFEGPMIVLGFVWLMLLIIELIRGSSQLLETLGFAIWMVFLLDFLIKLIVAPHKLTFLKSNILTVISLLVPALRVFRLARILRVLRFSRGLRLVKIVGSLNRGMLALSATMKRRAFGYITVLTLLIIFAGAAGMYAFENNVQQGLNSYGTSLWWTTMIMTTLGSDYWPKTTEGRILCIILSLYAFAVFGYITATIATFFIGQDAANKNTEIAGSEQIQELKEEIQELKKMIEGIANRK